MEIKAGTYKLAAPLANPNADRRFKSSFEKIANFPKGKYEVSTHRQGEPRRFLPGVSLQTERVAIRCQSRTGYLSFCRAIEIDADGNESVDQSITDVPLHIELLIGKLVPVEKKDNLRGKLGGVDLMALLEQMVEQRLVSEDEVLALAKGTE